MSENQSLHGSFKLNKKNYMIVMRDLRQKINDFNEYNYNVSIMLYDLLKLNKIKKNSSAAWDYIRNSDFEFHHGLKTIKNNNIFKPTSSAIEFTINEMFRNNNNTILKPRKNIFPKLTNKNTSIYFIEDNLQLSIVADCISSTFSIRVERNNKNVDKARNHPLFDIFFHILKSHSWAKKEGGFVREETESMSDFDGDDLYNISEYCFLGEIGKQKK